MAHTTLFNDSTISNKRKTDYLLLVLCLTLYSINIYYLSSTDSSPPTWDAAVHLRDTLVFHNIIRNPTQINLDIISEIIDRSEQYPLIRPSGYYPPFAPILTAIIYFFFGTSSKVAVMSNTIFLSILIFSLYNIGITIFSRNVALLASVLILLFPIVLNHSVIYYLDLPLTAMVALSIFVILKSEYFKNTTFSILSGFIFGLGMLTKWTFLFFTIGPLCYSLLAGYYSEDTQRKGSDNFRKYISNIIFFLIVSVFIFVPYYFPILPTLIEETFRYSHGIFHSKQIPLLSLPSLSFYPMALWKHMITPFGFTLFALGITLLSFSKHSYKTLILILTIVPYLIFTLLIENKQPRYMMPWLVPISLIVSYGISEIGNFKIPGRHAKIKTFLIPLALMVFLVFFLLEDLRLSNSIVMHSEEDWKIDEIVSVLERDLKDSNNIQQLRKNPKYLGVIPDHRYINGQTIRYYATRRRLPLNVIKLQNYNGTALEEFIEKFNRYDYIVTKNPSTSVVDSFQKSTDDMHKFFYSHRKHFEHLKTFNEPDGSEVSIFKRRE